MTSSEIRSRFLEFFKKRGHTIIPSASLVTSDEKGITNPTLFNTAGMQPLIPYLLGEPHPLGKRLVDVQKCLRTVDIDDIGDNTHATFFEMLGNWSLGDYFKKEAIEWSYEFLTSKEEGLGLDPNRLYVTVFEGDTNAPRDDEAANIWKDVFKKNNVSGYTGDTSTNEAGRIFYMPASANWWEAGDNGPCGPDTEMFYDISNTFKGRALTKDEYIQADSKREVVEVWNDVFMQYEKKDGKIVGKLAKPSVDTGAGLERLTMTMQGVDNIYDTDLLSGLMAEIKKYTKVEKITHKDAVYITNSQRIIVDHIRSAFFLITDGIIPGAEGRSYVLRKLLRRMLFNVWNIKVDLRINEYVNELVKKYSDIYPDNCSKANSSLACQVILDETNKFIKILQNGGEQIVNIKFSKERQHNLVLTADESFNLFTTHGYPLEIIKDLADKLEFPLEDSFDQNFNLLMEKHKALSRSGAEQKFKGGLADANDPMVLRYHTATHLLHQALHDVLGEEAGNQKGSNITAERLRFDFMGTKLTDEQKKRVEDIVNEKIAAGLPMNQVVMPKAEAEKTGARHFFGEKYGDEVSIYFIGNDLQSAYSKEFCGGPHVKNTKELAGPEGMWKFKIQKEEAVAQGVRRIKAVLA